MVTSTLKQKLMVYYWSERRCEGGSLQQGNAVTSKFVVIFSSSFGLITQLAKYRAIKSN